MKEVAKLLGGKGRGCWSRVKTISRKVCRLERKCKTAERVGNEESADNLRRQVASLRQRGDTYRAYIASPDSQIANAPSKRGGSDGKRQR